MQIVKVESQELPVTYQESRGLTLINFNVEQKERQDNGAVAQYYEYCQTAAPSHLKESQYLDILNEAKLQSWKESRGDKVANITVTYQDVVYQGDETSQTRMSRAIVSLPDDTTILPWVSLDNSTHLLTSSDLQAILGLAGLEQSRIWTEGRPV